MNDCSTYGEALENAALGGDVPEHVRMHLRACGDCAALLERQRAIVREFDAVISARANAQLPADLGARVLAQVPLGAVRRSPTRAFGQPLAALAVAVILLGAVAYTALAPQRVAQRHDAAQLASWQSPTAALLQPVR
jgi:hypothetical protein